MGCSAGDAPTCPPSVAPDWLICFSSMKTESPPHLSIVGLVQSESARTLLLYHPHYTGFLRKRQNRFGKARRIRFVSGKRRRGFVPIQYDGFMRTGGDAGATAIAAAGIYERGLAAIDLQDGLASTYLPCQALSTSLTTLVDNTWDVHYLCLGCFHHRRCFFPPFSVSTRLSVHAQIPHGGIWQEYSMLCSLCQACCWSIPRRNCRAGWPVVLSLSLSAQFAHPTPHVHHKGDSSREEEQARDASQRIEEFDLGPAI